MANILYQLAANQPQINALQLGAGPRVSQYREPNLSAAYQVMLEGTRGFEDLDPIGRYVAARQAQQGLDANTLRAVTGAESVRQQGAELARQHANEELAQNALREAVAKGNPDILAAVNPKAAKALREYQFGDQLSSILQKSPSEWTPQDQAVVYATEEGRAAAEALSKRSKEERDESIFNAQKTAALITAARNNPQFTDRAWAQIRPMIASIDGVPVDQIPEQPDPHLFDLAESYTASLLSNQEKLRGGNKVAVNVDTGTGDIFEQAFMKKSAEEEGKRTYEFETQLNDQLAKAQDVEYRADRMYELANKVGRTGQLVPLETYIRQGLLSFGIESAANADTEELQRLGNQAVMDVLSQFKGATSEKELDFARTQVGDITKSREGIRRFALVQKALAQRIKNKARLYDEYVNEQGSPRGFRRAWLKYQRVNPLLPKIDSVEKYNALPIGTIFRDENGKLRVKTKDAASE